MHPSDVIDVAMMPVCMMYCRFDDIACLLCVDVEDEVYITDGMASLNADDEPIEVDECVAEELIELNCHDDDIEDVERDVILDVNRVNEGV